MAPKKPPAADLRKGLRVDGVFYLLDMGAVTGSDELALYRACGFTLAELMEMLEAGKASIFAIAALMWLAARQTGQAGDFDEIASSVTISSNFEFLDGDDLETEIGAAVPLVEGAS